MAATPAEPVENSVKRLPWEARHEWESRVKFVEDNSDAYGLEKAINLSLVWSNMKFLGCSYPPRVEEKVAHYPLPDLSTLRSRRKQGEGSQRSSGQSKPTGKRDEARDFDRARQDKRKRAYDTTDSGEADLPHELFSESAIAAKVDALIAAVRKQTEPEAKTLTRPPSSHTPAILQEIGKVVCLCDACLGQSEPSAIQRLNTVVQRYRNQGKNLEHSFESSLAGPSSSSWSLLLNGVQVGKSVHGKKKTVAKNDIAEEVMEMLLRYQESHGMPPCPKGVGKGGGRKQPHSRSQDYRIPKRPALGGGDRPVTTN